MAEYGVGVVSVNAVHLYLFAVDKHNSVFYLNPAYAQRQGNELILCNYIKRIKLGCFVAPQPWRVDFLEYKLVFIANARRLLRKKPALGGAKPYGKVNGGVCLKLYPWVGGVKAVGVLLFLVAAVAFLVLCVPFSFLSDIAANPIAKQ